MRGLIALTVLIACCTGCSDASTWVHHDLGLRLETPEGWRAQSAAHGLLARWVDGSGASLSIASETLPRGMSLETWVEVALERSATDLPGDVIAEATTIGTQPGWRIERQFPGGRRQAHVVIVRAERVVVITATSGADGRAWTTAEGALSGLSLIEP